MTKPPKAPIPPTHPAVPPIESGTTSGTSLKTAALQKPIPQANITTAQIERTKLLVKVRMKAATQISKSENTVSRLPPKESDIFPPTTLSNEARIENIAVMVPAITSVV